MNESAPHSLITPDVQALAQGSVLAWLATVDERGQPHVTPKEIFALPDAHHAVVAHIASPGSVRRIRTHAQVALTAPCSKTSSTPRSQAMRRWE